MIYFVVFETESFKHFSPKIIRACNIQFVSLNLLNFTAAEYSLLTLPLEVCVCVCVCGETESEVVGEGGGVLHSVCKYSDDNSYLCRLGNKREKERNVTAAIDILV
jgi:hypothetical protein